MSNYIAVMKDGHEGGIHIDIEGKVTTPTDERPEWADGYAVALLGERIGWYEKRVGSQLPESMRRPEVLLADDVEWIGLDQEGAEVHIEANGDTRMTILAGLLEIDREDPSAKSILDKAIARASVDETYSTQPTSEATLEEAEGKSFEEVGRTAVTG